MSGSCTSDDLVAAAAKAGHPDLTTRAITDWVQRGLLDRPTRQSKGRGKGSVKAVYSQAQHDLLLLLLSKRSDSSALNHLLVVPIAIWLYWSEDYVPTRQAHRALANWSKSFGTSSAARARTGVEALVDQIAHPEASDTVRHGLQRTLTRAATSKVMPSDLQERTVQVVDPYGDGVLLGLPGIPLQPEAVINAWLMQRHAMSKLIASQVTDTALERARSELLQSVNEYRTLRPLLAVSAATDPFDRIKASALELETLVQNAPKDLLLTLASVLNLGVRRD